MFPNVPEGINGNIERLLDKIGTDILPEPVPVKVETDGRPESCYYNVRRKIERNGGSIHYGWALWETTFMVEGEHHAVWESLNGELICVTPRPFACEQILFLPDNDKPYNGISYDNVRFNTSGNPLIDHFIRLAEINEILFRLGKRTGEHEIHLPPAVAQQIQRNKDRQQNLGLFHLEGGKLGSRCFCVGLKKYSECHGKNLMTNAEREFKEVQVQFSNIS